ncbi:hypothetical protein GCM10028791_27290 [Echinicola sediminis]
MQDLICYSNDLSSYDKEERDGDFHNLVLLQEMQYGIPREQAIDRIQSRLSFLKTVLNNQLQSILHLNVGNKQQKHELILAIHRMLLGMEFWVKEDTNRYSP